MLASSRTSRTIFATPNFISPLSVTTRAFLKPRLFTTVGSSFLAPGPKYDTSFRINLLIIMFFWVSLFEYCEFITFCFFHLYFIDENAHDISVCVSSNEVTLLAAVTCADSCLT